MPTFTDTGTTIAYDVAGAGLPVLLLHGFPQTRALWRHVSRDLSRHFTVVAPDLRGYGASSKPVAAPDLSNYSFRAMADDARKLMASLGFERFHLVGHDRGARVAYRLALDTPEAVTSTTLMDIVPTDHLLDNWTFATSKAYFHWSFLAQSAPFPEHMIGADPDHFYEACLLGWGGAKLSDFSELEAYREAWRDPGCIAGMTNDYRAAVTIDQVHDRLDKSRILPGPALVLYGKDGVMARHFDVPEIWASRFRETSAEAISGGHFFVDQNPGDVSNALLPFLQAHSSAS